MNVLLIYFSQTGNTKKIAKEIKKGIKESGNYCEIIKIKEVKQNRLKNFDLIGIGTPTFRYRDPRNIRLFIQQMEVEHKKPCFIFCTHGSQIGNTFYYMNEELNKKGYIVIGTFDCYASSSIQFYPQPMHTEGHPDELELKRARNFGYQICNFKLNMDLIPKFELIMDTWWAKESRALNLDTLRRITPQFEINVDKCTKCLTCQINCPVDAIDINSDPPQIQKESCIFCWYCEKSCPSGAIKADWSEFKRRAAGNLLKYIKILEEAEKQGKFIPYVNYKEIK